MSQMDGASGLERCDILKLLLAADAAMFGRLCWIIVVRTI
jgi:hypothetical protein